MSVKFKCKQRYCTIAYGTLFPQVSVYATNGYTYSEDTGKETQLVQDDMMEEIKKLPDPSNVNGSYTFSEGIDHNELTVEREDVIEAMRAYIRSRGDTFIEEIS